MYTEKNLFAMLFHWCTLHVYPLLPVFIDGFNNSPGKTSLISLVIKDNKTNKYTPVYHLHKMTCIGLAVFTHEAKDNGNIIPWFIWSEMIAAMMNCCPEAIATDSRSVATVTKYLIFARLESYSFILLSWISQMITNEMGPLISEDLVI